MLDAPPATPSGFPDWAAGGLGVAGRRFGSGGAGIGCSGAAGTGVVCRGGLVDCTVGAPFSPTGFPVWEGAEGAEEVRGGGLGGGGGRGRDPAEDVVGYLVVPPQVTDEMKRFPSSAKMPTARSQLSFMPCSFLSGWHRRSSILRVRSAVLTARSESRWAPKRRRTQTLRIHVSNVEDAFACKMS